MHSSFIFPASRVTVRAPFLTVLVAVAAPSFAPAARADAPPIAGKLSPFELARRDIALSALVPGAPEDEPVPVTVRQGSQEMECEVLLSSGALTQPTGAEAGASPGACPLLWSASSFGDKVVVSGTTAAGAFAIDLAPERHAAGADVVFDDDQLALAPGDEPVLVTPAGWVAADGEDAADGVIALDPAARRAAEEGKLFLATRTDDGFSLHRAKRGTLVAQAGDDAAAGSAAAAPPASSPAAKVVGGDPEGACPAQGTDGFQVLCVDAFQKTPVLANVSASSVILRPNRAILVVVKHEEGLSADITLTGKVALSPPKLRDATRGKALKPETSRRVFAPRAPGELALTVTLNGQNKATLTSMSFELIVESTWAGAVRIGVAAVGLGAVDARYGVRPHASGAAFGEVFAEKASPVDGEIVLGYAPYLDDGGRPDRGCDLRPLCFGPYVGLGVLAPGADGAVFFKSLHVGLEWEPAPGFSVALTLVGRRVDRLAPDVHIGSPLAVGTSPTREQLGLGVGLVVNVSPDFLKIASGTGATTAGGFARLAGF